MESYQQDLSPSMQTTIERGSKGLPLQSTRNHSHSLSNPQVTASSVRTQAKPRLDGWKLEALHIASLLRSGGGSLTLPPGVAWSLQEVMDGVCGTVAQLQTELSSLRQTQRAGCSRES